MMIEEILKRPIINEKFSKLNEKGVYGFVVERTAKKPAIKAAVEKMFGVQVAKVNTLIQRGKPKARFSNGRNMSGRTQAVKKAVVYLREGQVIDFYANL